MTGSLQNFAHNARRNMTAAEECLWRYLRSDIALKKTPHVIADLEKIYRRKNKKTITKKKSLKETPTPYPSPQGGGEKDNQSCKMSDPPSLPSPLEGEG